MPDAGTPADRTRFHWRETGARLEDVLDEVGLEPATNGREFRGTYRDGTQIRFTPPLVQPLAHADQSAIEYLGGLDDELGCECVVLLRAGASALGLWRDDELLFHKAQKKYVVRGSGKAQPTHLESKGKSRYGSRLRLMNARSLLHDVNTRLRDWSESEGPFDRVYYACPVRLWSDLLDTRPPPPFDPGKPPIKLPLDVHTPTFAELERVRRLLVRGTIEYVTA